MPVNQDFHHAFQSSFNHSVRQVPIQPKIGTIGDDDAFGSMEGERVRPRGQRDVTLFTDQASHGLFHK